MRRPRRALVFLLLTLSTAGAAQDDPLARGRRELKDRDYEAAVRDFSLALKTRDDAETHFLLGYAHFLRGYKNGRVIDREDAQAAIEQFKKTHALDPRLKSVKSPIKIYLGLGLAYEAVNAPEKALATYREALRAVPDDFMAPLCAARLRHSLGDTDRAAENLTVSFERARGQGRDGDLLREIKTKPYFAVLLDSPATRRVVADHEKGMSRAMVPAPPARGSRASPSQDVQDIIEAAERLSHSPGHLSESIAGYRQALELEPMNREARLGLARTTSWDGQHAAANALYDEVLAQDPEDAQALLGRAQIARWDGKLRASDRFIRRAAKADPENPVIQAERVQVDLNLGRYTRARAGLEGLRESAPDAYDTREAQEVYDAATAPRLWLKTAYTGESTPFRRFDLIARGEFHPLPDTRLRPELVGTRFADDAQRFRRRTAGVAARQNLPGGFYADGHFLYRVLESSGITREYSGELGGRPLSGPVTLHGGLRLRAIVDDPAGYEDIVTSEGGSSGGSTLSSVRERVQIHERFAGCSIIPFAPMYLYFDGAWGDVSDGNRRRALSAGGGVELLSLLRISSIFAVTAKLDHFRLEFTRPSRAYYAPPLMAVNNPGLAIRMNGARLSLGMEGARSFYEDRTWGYAASAFLRLKLYSRFVLSGRVETIKTNVYHIINETGGVEVRF